MFGKKIDQLPVFLLAILLLLGFLYRVYGLSNNYSFWIDEDHVAIFVRAILERGKPVLTNGYSTGVYQFLQYWTSAISAKIFGLNEFAIRLPSVFFGVLTILAVYLLGKKIFNRKVGLLSAFFVAFINIEILFSRQARPYQALQFFYLLGFYFIYRLANENKFNWSYFLGFLGCGIFASLMHGLGLMVFFFGFVYLLIFKTSWFKKKLMLLGVFFFLFFGWIFRVPIFSVFSQIGKINNFFYYRVFLTHNYISLCLLAVLGSFLLFWRKNYRELLLFIIPLGVQTIIVSFFLGQPFTRYLYPVFPFIILLASYGIVDIGNWILEIGGRETRKDIRNKIFDISKNTNIHYPCLAGRQVISGLLVFVVIFSLWKTDKISLLPKKIYSLNADMQEIPEIDWKKVYGFVGEKLKQNPGSVLVTNWSDLPVWYLGEGKPDFLVRKNVGVEKDIFSKAMILSDLNNFHELVKNKKKGLIIIDSWDNAIPEGVTEYCHNNLKREFELDRLYPVQPRYWTVWVYSWGLN